ncbi:MAG TPA: RNA methyltransferase [bacterium]
MISKASQKYYSSLKKRKTRDREQRFLIEGLRLCEEVLDSNYEVETALFCAALLTSEREHELLDTLRRRGISVLEISLADLKRLGETVNSSGIICVVKKPEFDLNEIVSRRPRLLIALDRIGDPGNLGTIVRTGNWFGAAAVLLSEESVEVTNPKVVRASMGGVFHLPVFENCYLEEKLKILKNAGYQLWVAAADGDVDYRRSNFGEWNILVLGNEIEGVHHSIKALANGILKIPKPGKGESLNVAVAAGILLAEMDRGVE